ncbi:hypothetical protein BGX31_000174 [Mortierella sp. GBA43]|nr:hypothetical protein BGX31_000174 [Mortierella sp. GBA43]
MAELGGGGGGGGGATGTTMATTATGVAQPIMPRSRPTMAQFRMRDQPSKMIIPPPYGQEKVQEAAKALAAGIPDGIPNMVHKPVSVLSDSGSGTSDDEPEVRVHVEIHLQDAETQPICPLNEKNMNTLTQELELNTLEREQVQAIQTTEELAAYFEKIPRDYDVQIILADNKPGSPGVKFATDYHLLNVDSLAVWAGQAFWAARYDMDDLFTKVMKLIEFCALISFGAFSSDHLDRTSTGFITSYMVLKAILVIEYGNVLYWARKNRSKKSLTPLWLQIGSNLLAILIWGLSILVHSLAWRYVMWYFSILLEVAVLVSFGRRASVTFAGSHLPERFALFTIIVLGENIIGLIGLSAGASAWVRGSDPFLVLFLLTVVILYALWWLYFDDFSEDVFHKTTALSQLWAYLHLPFHICIVLVGTGALDLIRLYKLEHHITEITMAPEHMISGPQLSSFSTLPAGAGSGYSAYGFQVPARRAAAGSGAGSLTGRDTDYDLTKQYFLVVCGLVFLCNSLLKWINLRSYDKFQRIVYLSRFFCAVFIFCLLAVPLDKMTPFALLGSMAFFCVAQVGVDLAVIYFGAYGFVDDLEAWARSARASIDLTNFLPTPLGGRSRANSRAPSRAGSVVNVTSPAPVATLGAKHHRRNNSTASLIQTFYTQPYRHHERQLSLQRQASIKSQQQQQSLYNMHVNANSLGVSGAYGNLAHTLAEIKRREVMTRGSRDGPLPMRPLSLSMAERGHAERKPSSPGPNGHGPLERENTWQQHSHQPSRLDPLEESHRLLPASGSQSEGDALGLTNLFIQPHSL